MPRFHLNPTTGVPGECRAKIACPFGLSEDHFTSPDEARSAYERIMGGQAPKPLTWMLSPKGEAIVSPEDLPALTRQCFETAQANEARFGKDSWDAIHFYAMGGFEAINGVLRGQDVDCYGRHIEDWRRAYAVECIEKMDKMFDVLPKQPRTVYRYANKLENESVKASLDAIVAEGTYRDPAFMSTSASVDYPAYKVMENSKDLFLIEMVADTTLDLQPEERMGRGDIQSHELEVLLPRNTEFRVVGVEYRKKISLGTIRDTLLPMREWEDSAAEKKIRKADHATMPVLRLVQAS